MSQLFILPLMLELFEGLSWRLSWRQYYCCFPCHSGQGLDLHNTPGVSSHKTPGLRSPSNNKVIHRSKYLETFYFNFNFGNFIFQKNNFLVIGRAG